LFAVCPPELRQQSMHGNRRRQRVYRAHSLMLVVVPRMPVVVPLMLVVVPRMLVVIPLMIVVIPLMLVVIPLMLVVIPRLVPLMIERAL